MRPTTTTALALAGTALALPAVAVAEYDDPPTPTDITLSAPFVGHLSIGTQMQAERRVALQQRLTPRAVKLAGRTARVKGVAFSERDEKRELRGESPTELREEIRENRRELRRARRAAERQEAAAPAEVAGGASTAAPHLEAIAACESGGDPTTNTGNGFYGKYQFTQSTWESVGGSGNPAAASEAEQDQRAAALYAQSGAAPWPVCGR